MSTRNVTFLNWILCLYPLSQFHSSQGLLQDTVDGEEEYGVWFLSDSGGIPLPSILLANVQSLDNKVDELRARISFQRDILCFTETWLSRDILSLSIQPAGFSIYRTDRNKEGSGKKKGGGVCIMINHSWWDCDNIKKLK